MRVETRTQVRGFQDLAESLAALLPSAAASAAVVVLEHGEASYAFAGDSRVDQDTGFEFASVTKVMTAALLLLLEEHETIDLEAPVARYLGAEARSSVWQSLPVHSLLTHSSGLPFLPPNIVPAWIWLTGRADDPFAGYTTVRLEQALRETVPQLGAGWAYSNYGYAVAGLIAERSTGHGFSALLEQRVLWPVGMQSAAVDRWITETWAPPLSRDGRPTSVFTFDAMAPAGAVRGSVRDAQAFLRFVTTACEKESRLARAVCRTLEPTGLPAGSLGEMGSGWVLSEREQTTVIWHNGGTGGYASFLGLSPDHARAVAILTNVSGLREIDELGRAWLSGVE